MDHTIDDFPALTEEQLYTRLQSSSKGLSSGEALQRVKDQPGLFRNTNTKRNKALLVATGFTR